jgi:hypothetical protein
MHVVPKVNSKSLLPTDEYVQVSKTGQDAEMPYVCMYVSLYHVLLYNVECRHGKRYVCCGLYSLLRSPLELVTVLLDRRAYEYQSLTGYNTLKVFRLRRIIYPNQDPQ